GGNNIFLDDINIVGVSNGVSVPVITNGLSLQIYPNPSRGDMVLELYSPDHDHLRITLFNSLGQLVGVIADKQAAHENRITIPAQAAGVYLLVVEQNGRRLSKRIVFE